MPLARLLAAALVICSLSAFGQDHQSQTSQPSTRSESSNRAFECAVEGAILRNRLFSCASNPSTVATASEPWRIFPDAPALAPGPTRLDQTPADQLKLEFRVRQLESQLDRLSGEGPTCYAIRSYMVARDSKDSDSTHPAGYSTCQPVGRYGVKTITSGPEPADR